MTDYSYKTENKHLEGSSQGLHIVGRISHGLVHISAI